jgi:hypothetical protein
MISQGRIDFNSKEMEMTKAISFFPKLIADFSPSLNAYRLLPFLIGYGHWIYRYKMQPLSAKLNSFLFSHSEDLKLCFNDLFLHFLNFIFFRRKKLTKT